MITLSGKSVFGGVAIGKIAFYKRQEKQIRRYHVEDTEAEVARFEEAQETAIAQLGELYDKAMEDVGEANAAIFEVHQMMLMDLDYVDSIKNIITTQEVNAEYAVATTGDNFSRMFASVMVISFPCFTPRLITAIMLFALTSRVSPVFLILISEVFFAIAFTRIPAGLA